MLNEEGVFIPFAVSDLPVGPWLVFSPHADDETFGMGGALLKAASNNIETHLVVLTDGALGGEEQNLAEVREKEVREAASALGIASLDCWNGRDRGLIFDKLIVERILSKIRDIAPAVVFFPGPMEPHPDHRNTALLVWSALQGLVVKDRPSVYSYEISVQSPINVLVDISQEHQKKSRVMAIYSSQNCQNNYEDLVRALNKSRTFSLPKGVDYAEGFYRYSEQQLENSLETTLASIVKLFLESER